MKRQKYRIIFLNQMAGPLFRELAEDLSNVWAPSLLYTGHQETLRCNGTECLRIIKAPEYVRTSVISRLFSWIKFFFAAFFISCRQSSKSLLFIVSNPPFLGIIGLLLKVIRKQRYVVLIYDIYPDILVEVGSLKKSILSRCWDIMNRVVYRNASLLITIGQDMSKRLERKISASEEGRKKLIHIPCWVDVASIKPIPKHENWFAKKHGLIEKTIVLYSGNMGNTHDIESLLEAAKILKEEQGIKFLIIGEGAKWALVRDSIYEFHLKNVILLHLQSEEVFPFSLAAGDIGVATYQKGAEGCMIPSKFYYYMAAGLAPLVLSSKESDLTMLVEKKRCGIWVKSGNVKSLVLSIKELHNNPEALHEYKKIARKTAEESYSRRNTIQFIEALKEYVL